MNTRRSLFTTYYIKKSVSHQNLRYDPFFNILQPLAVKVSKSTQIDTGDVALIPNIIIDLKKSQKNLRIRLKIIYLPIL